MIKEITHGFYLSTKSSSLVLGFEANHLILLYYGPHVPEMEDAEKLKRTSINLGNGVRYEEGKETFLDNLALELSTPYKGDFGSPSLIIEGGKSPVYDFVYESYEIRQGDGIKAPEEYPFPRDASEELIIKLSDHPMGVEAYLHYLLFKEAEVVGRYVEIHNVGEGDIHLRKAASMQLCLENRDFELVSYYGGWADEFKENVSPITHTRQVVESTLGSSGARHNPFFYIKKTDTGLNQGLIYGFNLIYSGNHFFEVECQNDNLIRISNGIAQLGFDEVLKVNESFNSPLAILSVSDGGVNGLRENLHFFHCRHIFPKRFEQKELLIDYNSWEGCGMKFSERKVKGLMKKAASLGMELFVLDDGWFGNRNDDSTSLGDWDTNRKKLPHGIKGLSDYAHKLGMRFGLWFEPEMISPKSNLYRAHPDWAVQDGIHSPSLGRHQLHLDLTNPEVQGFIYDTLAYYLHDEGVDFVKWDYNRPMSDIPFGDGAFFHHYILGLYKVLKRLTADFPDVIFLNCASGGNRCDLGMLSYFPLTWVSDDTDGFQRALIQEGMNVGYPPCCMSNHVSSKTSMQLVRKTSLGSKFDVAAIGVLGYELDLGDLSKHDEEEIKRQIAFYKEHRHLLQWGNYAQHSKLSESNLGVRQMGGDGKAIVVRTLKRQLVTAQVESLEVSGLDPLSTYKYMVRPEKHEITRFGPLVNMISPIHMKEDGHLLLMASHHLELDGEKFEGFASGALLNNGGVKLPYQWQGTALDEHVAFYGDFGSRLFLIEKMEN